MINSQWISASGQWNDFRWIKFLHNSQIIRIFRCEFQIQSLLLLPLFQDSCQVDVLTFQANDWNLNHCFHLGLFVRLLKSQDVSPVLFTVCALPDPGWFSYRLESNIFCTSIPFLGSPEIKDDENFEKSRVILYHFTDFWHCESTHSKLVT